MKHLIFLSLLFFTLNLVVPFHEANAAVFDVTDGAGLQTALTTAQDNDEDDTINLAAGNYDASGGTFTYVPDNTVASEENFSLTLVGADTETTILDGGDLFQVLNLNTTGLSSGDDNADIAVRNVTIQNGGTASFGGGISIFTNEGDATLEGCIVQDNATTSFGAGADLATDSGDVFVQDNQFISNNADDDAGGIECFVDDGSCFVINNVFFDNHALTGVAGGALIQFDGGDDPGDTLFVINNTFLSNTSGTDGGGIFVATDVDSETAEIYNNIVFANMATGDGDDIFLDDDADGNSTGSVVNIFNNDFTELFVTCDVGCTSNLSQGDNLNTDPMLLNAGIGDFHLDATSPLIDEGDPAAPELPSEDFEGDDRIVGDAPDMGADEFFEPPADGNEGGCSLNSMTTPGTGNFVMMLLLMLGMASFLVLRRQSSK